MTEKQAQIDYLEQLLEHVKTDKVEDIICSYHVTELNRAIYIISVSESK